MMMRRRRTQVPLGNPEHSRQLRDELRSNPRTRRLLIWMYVALAVCAAGFVISFPSLHADNHMGYLLGRIIAGAGALACIVLYMVRLYIASSAVWARRAARGRTPRYPDFDTDSTPPRYPDFGAGPTDTDTKKQ